MRERKLCVGYGPVDLKRLFLKFFVTAHTVSHRGEPVLNEQHFPMSSITRAAIIGG